MVDFKIEITPTEDEAVSVPCYDWSYRGYEGRLYVQEPDWVKLDMLSAPMLWMWTCRALIVRAESPAQSLAECVQDLRGFIDGEALLRDHKASERERLQEEASRELADFMRSEA